MSVSGDATTTLAAASPEPSPAPGTRPRGRVAFALPLITAASAGVAIGASPRTTLVVGVAVVAALVLAVRLEWAALAVIGSAVFEDYLDVLSPWATEWLVLLLVVAWAIRRARGPLHEHRLLTTSVPAGVFAAVVLIAAAVHPNGAAGFDVCARYAQLVVVLLVLADCLSGPLEPRRAVRIYVWSCVLAAVCGILTALVDEPHRVAGPLAGADDLAFFLVAAVPLLGTVRTRTSQPVWWVWAAFATVLVALVGTQSQPAIIALAVMLVVAVAFRMIALRYASVLLVVVATGVAFVFAVLPHPAGQAISDPQRYAEIRFDERNEFRAAALRMTSDHPILGRGPGSFALFHQDYRDDDADPTDLDLDVAASSALEASAELGVVGAVALAAVFVVPIAAARRRWRRDGSGITAATLLALVGMLVASLVQTSLFLLPLWLMAAVAAALGRPAPPRFALFGDNSSGQVGSRS